MCVIMKVHCACDWKVNASNPVAIRMMSLSGLKTLSAQGMLDAAYL